MKRLDDRRGRGRPRKGILLQSDPAMLHMRYLDRLLRMPQSRSGSDKRVHWPKFCHVCGADISYSGRGVRVCEQCEPVRQAQFSRGHQWRLREDWRPTIQNAADRMRMP